jgi:hypothetical protein
MENIVEFMFGFQLNGQVQEKEISETNKLRGS